MALGAGVLIVLNWVLFFAAIPRVSIAIATVLFHIQPFFVIGLGAWWLGERVSRAQVIACVVALAGLVLATGLIGSKTSLIADIVLSDRRRPMPRGCRRLCRLTVHRAQGETS